MGFGLGLERHGCAVADGLEKGGGRLGFSGCLAIYGRDPIAHLVRGGGRGRGRG